MRTLLISAVVASALVWGALTMTRMDAGIEMVLDTLQRKARAMNQLHFSKTLSDGSTVTWTATQAPGESHRDFGKRARAEWAEFCEGLGE